MSAERKQFKLGLVGYGEIGSTVGRGLRGAGLEAIFSYDKYAFDGPYAELIQSRAREAGVTLVRSNQELADAADLIFSVTPGSASLESAEAFAPCLTSRHIFTDFASATPKIKIGVAERLAGTGALVGDGSIEGTPLHGYSMRMLSSGPAGRRVCDSLIPWGMQIELVGGKLGTASGIKILRSVLIKGIEALTDEMLLAARHYGLDEIVLASASKTLARPWMAATSKKPASPAQAPAIMQQITISLPTGRPCASAARALPPATRTAKPKVVRARGLKGLSKQSLVASAMALQGLRAAWLMSYSR